MIKVVHQFPHSGFMHLVPSDEFRLRGLLLFVLLLVCLTEQNVLCEDFEAVLVKSTTETPMEQQSGVYIPYP